MELTLSPAERAFQSEATAFLATHWDRHSSLLNGPRLWLAQRRYMAALAERNWLVPQWPQALGGAGWNDRERWLWERAAAEAAAPQLSPHGPELLGPLLQRVGSPAQRQTHLPAIANGHTAWVQAFVEDSGALDVQAIDCVAESVVLTTGERGYRLSGEKPWVLDMPPDELGQTPWLYVLARLAGVTQAADGVRAHEPIEGLGVFMLPANTDGVTITPRAMLADPGGRQGSVHSVVFEAVALTRDALLGEPGSGASHAEFIEQQTMATPVLVARNQVLLNSLREFLCSEAPESGDLWSDEDFRGKFHSAEIELAALVAMEARAWDVGAGPSGDANQDQIRSQQRAMRLAISARSESLGQQLADLQVEALGYFALPFVDFSALDNEGSIGPEFAQPALLGMLSDRARAAIGVPREHLKNIIAKSVLTLPDMDTT